jgi:VIT1/CCC1 family predicted Fe2+/Mn2+ transporter
MLELYEKKGLSTEDSKTIIDILSKNKKVWVDAMMVEELGMLPEEEEDPVKNAIVTFVSFATFGLVPIFPFIIGEIA